MMMYDSSSNSSFGSGNNNNNNGHNSKKRTAGGKGTGFSPVRKMRKAPEPPTPPSPPSREPDIPWGDRKPAAKKKPADFVYEHSPDVISDIPIELASSPSSSNNKIGGIPVSRSSTGKQVSFITNNQGNNGLEKTKPIQQSKDKLFENHSGNNDKMSARELCWAAISFVLIVMLTVGITILVMNQQTRVANRQSSTSSLNNSPDEMGELDGISPIGIPSNGQSSSSDPSYKISAREEWELVRAAILDNNVTRGLFDQDAKDYLSSDIFFYDQLVSGMMFSEEKRDWVTAPPFLMEDDAVRMETIEGMSMEGDFGLGNFYRSPIAKAMTPNQKATAWLLYHDKLKDPNESVWRWAMASIYFKMGGENWAFYDDETSKNKWLTSAPLCEWERIYGSNGCQKRKQQQEPRLPVELDFDAANMSGPIAIEFALLLKPSIGDWFGKGGIPETAVPASETMVRSIALSDNRLTGTIPGKVFQYLMPSLGKLYLDNNWLTGSVPLELGGLDTLYVQNNALTGDWPQEFCESGNKTINGFGLDCDKIECSTSCCGLLQCYYSKSF